MAAGLVLAAVSGCGGSSADFPFDRQTVWRAAVGESLVWRPNLIDENNYIVESTKDDLGGVEYRYRLKVTRNPNLFARRPSTTVRVWMGQITPRNVSFTGLEREFLMSLSARLEGTSGSPGP